MREWKEKVATRAGGESVLGQAGASRPPHRWTPCLATHCVTQGNPLSQAGLGCRVYYVGLGKAAIKSSEPFLKYSTYNTRSFVIQTVFFIIF